MNIDPRETFDEFKNKFLCEFYSVQARLELKDKWAGAKFRPQDKSMNDYFTAQVREARYVAPDIDISEINFRIIKQLPTTAKQIFAQALPRLDIAYKEQNHEKSNSVQNPRSSNNAIRNIDRTQSCNCPSNLGDRNNESNTNVIENWRQRVYEPGNSREECARGSGGLANVNKSTKLEMIIAKLPKTYAKYVHSSGQILPTSYVGISRRMRPTK